ncbi:MAG: hypothetical protein HQ539_00025 [Parcubacteria group bacterium]|nr:hypothetical protein [Parcubacteria group bacterium]
MWYKQKKFYVWGFIVILVVITAIGKVFPEEAEDKLLASVQQFGPIRIGDDTIAGPGAWTFAPYMRIPLAKFYVSTVEDELWCSGEDCGIDGSLIETMGGWLQVENTYFDPEIKSKTGLNLEENKDVKSIVLIGDTNGKIVGIYPNRGLPDVMDILKLHPDLANFDLLPGVSEFRKLKVRMLAPLKPGDAIGHLSDILVENSITHIPKDKKFYLYSLQKRKYDIIMGMLNSIQHEPLVLGGQIMFGFGTPTESPYPEMPYQIPRPKFYVAVAEPDGYCVADMCGLEGASIKTMNGWLQVYNTKFVETKEFFEFDLSKNKEVSSMVIVSDQNGKIIGIYPNKGLTDVMDILKLHPDLTNFDLLPSISEFRKLKVGMLALLKPGETIGYLLDALVKHSMTHIPKYENEYACFTDSCRYPEPDPPHDFLFAEIDHLGGWFIANDEDNTAMIELFGLNPENVLSGKSSLVVLTDADGIIVALHPNKTLSDTFTILSQHLELIDIEKLQDGWHNFFDL